MPQKHYLLFYFQGSNCFTSSCFPMHFCVSKDGGRIMNPVPADDENLSKIRTNTPILFLRQQVVGTMLQPFILGSRKQG